MPHPTALIPAWARSAVAPHGGAFRALHTHELAAPVLQALLQRAGLGVSAVDAVVLGNALGAGGNPARMLALAAGLPDACAAMSVDSQCCAGLDAVSVAVGLLASGQASVVVAGGVEAWSRAPIRQTRPLHAGELGVTYERPPFAPDPARDPDLLQSAADYAAAQHISRAAQDAYAILSHQRAVASASYLAKEIVPVLGLQHDAYPRPLTPERAARMPLAVPASTHSPRDLSTLAVSPRADGAALVLLATPEACVRWGLQARVAWVASASVGGDSRTPMLSAQSAARLALQRAGLANAQALHAVELHDAFAVQALAFCSDLGLQPEAINRHGGGLARGHPIGASGAIALVRVLADLHHGAAVGAQGLAAIAGAGGIGASAVVQRV